MLSNAARMLQCSCATLCDALRTSTEGSYELLKDAKDGGRIGRGRKTWTRNEGRISDITVNHDRYTLDTKDR